MPHKAGIGIITGIVTEDGVPCSKRVALVDRSNLTIIQRTQSNADGKYTFSGLNTDTNDYLVFGVDDDDPLKNAEIHDYIRPISGHQGASYPYNWLWLVLQKTPTNVWTGQTQGDDFNGFSINAINKSGVIVPNQASQTPYAPNLPMTELNIGRIIATGFTPATQVTNTTDKFTLECVLDLASDSIMLSSSSAYSYYPSYSYYYYSIAYNKGVLKIGYCLGNNSTGYKQIILHNTPDNGIAHIVASFDFGNQCKLYINGELVATGDITNTKLNNGADINRLTYAVINGVPSDFHQSTKNDGACAVGRVGALACYYDLLTDEEVLEHYNALFTETLPRLTGYVKEILVDNPCHLYRLNEPDIVNGIVDYLQLDKKLIVNSVQAVAPNQPSIITGGNTALLNGTHFTGSNGYFTTSQDGFTFECVLRIDTDATNEQTLYSLATDNIVIKRLKTSGNVQISYPLNGTTETLQFNPLPQGELLHFALVIDKVECKARLYINGEKTEEKDITPAKINLTETNNNAVKAMIIGQNFIGLIGEVALYPKPLSDERIKAHYDAKDIM